MDLSNCDGSKRTRARGTSSTEVDGRHIPLLPPGPGAQYAARSVGEWFGKGTSPRLDPCETTGSRQHPLKTAGESGYGRG